MTRKITTLATVIGLAGLASASAAQDADSVWRADLVPMNTETTGSDATGTATLTVTDDTLTIHIDATGTPAGIMHLQHFHGFPEGDETSTCPSAEADANGDGIVDLIETEPGAGITMVPFHADPASMSIVEDSYPMADDAGAYTYEQSVSLSELDKAFAEEFPGQQIDFDRRVIFLHGVAEDTELPDSVQSLGEVPAHITLPIACGEIVAAEG